jgi:hypothetical protein
LYCHDPSEQVFHLDDCIIGIDWGKCGDKAIQTKMRKEKNDTYTLVEVKEL